MRKLQMKKPCQLDLNRDLHPYMLNSKPYSFHNIIHLPWIAWLRKGKGGTMRNGIKTSLASANISIYFSIIFQGPSKLSIFDHGALSLYMYSDFDMGKNVGPLELFCFPVIPWAASDLLCLLKTFLVCCFTKPSIIAHVLNQILFLGIYDFNCL